MSQVRAHLIAHVRPPQVDHALGLARRRRARQRFAHEHADDLGQRPVAALGDAGEAALPAMLGERGGEILGNAHHLAGADRLYARLLDRVEDRARHLAGRCLPRMQHGVVMAQLQRDGIRLAAHIGDLVRRQLMRRRRQPRLGAEQPVLARRERDGQIVALGDRPHGGAGDPLELLDAAFAVGIDHVSPIGRRLTPTSPCRRASTPFPCSAGNIRPPPAAPVRRTC
jgi:hypothetical protein